MTACLLAGGVMPALSGPAFQLRWTHSVKKVEWVEDWWVEPQALRLTGARVKGSGAGMEPGEGAILQDGWWVWPEDRRLPSLSLATSRATGAGWQLCDAGICRAPGEAPGAPVTLAPCPPRHLP
ncbi:DUF1850 domain-containing protein [Neotabrizicola sp. sgz301269]|uniref:DUF1850 domain-containing protein n=1 Tax=Neotabrizicola sp. sgz301269 TaxID=3276282 RepID=UPI00376FCD7A